MEQPDLDPILSGVAGQYLVAAQLTRLGMIATVTLRNTRGVDVLASNASGTRAVTIQVKTNRSSKRDWMLSNKAETRISRDLFYVFVNLNGHGGTPTFHVVPSKRVASHIKKRHEAYIAADSNRRQDSSMRKFRDLSGKYQNRWELLRLL